MCNNPRSDSVGFNQLVLFFRDLVDTDGECLAKELTTKINESLATGSLSIESPTVYLSTSLPSIIQKIVVQPMSLSLPWRAYILSRSDEIDVLDEYGGLKAILATVPNEYAQHMPILDDFEAPFSGSLIKHIADLINRAQNNLLVVNPYWSVSGVKQLEARIVSANRKCADAMILTPKNMKQDSIDGCSYFKSMLHDIGFQVQHNMPGELLNGSHPMLHAKVVISDQNLAYMGSANLSLNGLTQSIEVGVSIEGVAAVHLSEWFSNLARLFFEKSQ